MDKVPEMLPETHCANAAEELETIDVLVRPEDIAAAYRRAAQELEAAGNYQDAASRAQEYRQKAGRIEMEGKERLYRKACDLMREGKTVAEKKLAQDMFRRLEDFKDAAQLAKECERRDIKEAHRLTAIRFAIAAAVAAAVVAAVIFL